MVGSDGRGSVSAPSAVVPCRTHESARRNWWEPIRSAGPVATNKSAVPGRRRVPRSLALRPSNPVPGTVPWITPRTGLAVHICPFGQDEMYGPGPYIHNGLIHELAGNPSDLIPKFADVVDELWIHSSGRLPPMAHLLARLVAMNDRWAQPFGDFNHRWLTALFRPLGPVKDLLNGRWLGHPLHGAATDLPIGTARCSRSSSTSLDQRAAADIALVATIVTFMLAAAHRCSPTTRHRRHGPHAGDDARHGDDHRAGRAARLARDCAPATRPSGPSRSRSRSSASS